MKNPSTHSNSLISAVRADHSHDTWYVLLPIPRGTYMYFICVCVFGDCVKIRIFESDDVECRVISFTTALAPFHPPPPRTPHQQLHTPCCGKQKVRHDKRDVGCMHAGQERTATDLIVSGFGYWSV